MYTLSYIRKSLPAEKNSKSSLWVKLIIRKLSFIFTFIFINLGFSAKQVSLLSVVIAIVGSILLGINSFRCMIIGMILVNFWLVLDCVDGNIARCKGSSSLLGSFIDAISGYTILAFVYLGIGIASYNTCHFVPQKYKYILIVMGAIASIADILTRLIHQKYNNTILRCNLKVEKNDENKKSLAYIRGRLDKEIGISGLFMPLLIVSSIYKSYVFMLVFYMIFNVAAFIGVLVIYSIKS